MLNTELRPTPPFSLTILVLTLTAAASLLIALGLGSVHLSFTDLLSMVSTASADTLEKTVLLQLRLPRALTAFALGGLLALSGVLMQVLLRNPLADPYILGSSGGAAAAALLAMLMGINGWPVELAATWGAFIAILLVFALAHAEGSWSPTRLLLTGVIVAAGCGALVSLLLALSDETSLRGMLYWLMGEITHTQRALPLWLLMIGTGGVSYFLARHLNVMSRGELQAQTLGLNIKQIRIGLFALSALLTAAAVTTAGSIGFVGLIIPHLARRLVGADHRRLVPAVILMGGSLLTLADTAARTLFAPRQMPIGALTALIGVPVFIFLMFKQQYRH